MELRLRELRYREDYTQAYVAAHLNIKQNSYSQYENGVHQVPIVSLMKLAELYDTSVDYLVGLTDHPASYPRNS
jgi:transcriptional regulator with XRE-family HTH domain